MDADVNLPSCKTSHLHLSFSVPSVVREVHFLALLGYCLLQGTFLCLGTLVPELRQGASGKCFNK